MIGEIKCPQCGSDNLEYRDVIAEREGETERVTIDYFCKACGEVFKE